MGESLFIQADCKAALHNQIFMVSDCLKFRVHAGDSVKGNNIDKYLMKYISQKEDIVSGDIEGRTRELQTIYDINSFKTVGEDSKEIFIYGFIAFCL